ncbi:hypothetical protein BS50DRAFT_573678 [Corynespora cassiicola Philippines]|uniref:Uncharacterized protein n=1 Tax=Corynespora cassiicola Philippines TaxID=1448308 RepID=A0A2T2NN87_CORCC|nr:hypothetical protein BS50DRAFT_573678 [Corynespora cassiicola Philippines]
MTSARAQRLHGSLGDSWGDADYSSDGGASIDTASDLTDDGSGSERDYLDESDMTTPLPSKTTRTPSRTPQTPQETPLKISTRRAVSGHSQVHKSSPLSQSTLHSPDSTEPSFIMPSGSIDGFHNGSPLRDSQMRIRKSNFGSPEQVDRALHRRPLERMSSSQPDNRHIDLAQALASSGTSYRDTLTEPKYAHGLAQAPPSESERQERDVLYYVHILWQSTLQPTIAYALDVFGYTMRHFMKPVLAFALGIFMIFALLQVSSGLLRFATHKALAPICAIPGSSYLLSACDLQAAAKTPDFEELADVQSTFEDILQSSVDAYALPAHMKTSEAAIRDLRSLVKFSRLPSRAELDVEFSAFIEAASEICLDLARYNAKIGVATDKIISTNRWTMTVLEGVQEKEASYGAVDRLYYSFAGAPSLQKAVFEQYTMHLSRVAEEIRVLIVQSFALLQLLEELHHRLSIIAEIAQRDQGIVLKDKDEVLSWFWTRLGGNKANLRSHENSLRLLREVGVYEKRARTHVADTLLKLQKIAANLESLGESVAAPELGGYASGLPLHYYMEVIGGCLDRLDEARGESLRIEKAEIRKALYDPSDSGRPQLSPGSREPPFVQAANSKPLPKRK